MKKSMLIGMIIFVIIIVGGIVIAMSLGSSNDGAIDTNSNTNISSNKSKNTKAITLEEFKRYVEKANYEIGQDSNYSSDNMAYFTLGANLNDIEFWELKDEKEAKSSYEFCVNNWKQWKQNSDSAVDEKNKSNYNYFCMTNNDTFYYEVQVGNTTLTCECPIKYKSDAVDFIKSIGYWF